MFIPRDRRRQRMHKSLALAGAILWLAVPAAAQADDTPSSGDVANASQECRTERGATSATREAFAAHYGTGKNKRNAFGKCVAAKAREEMKEREAAEDDAAKTCA